MADRNWQDRAIEIVGGIGDRLSDLARRTTKPATDYLEPRLKDVAKTSSDVATQIWEDPEIIFGEDTGNPLPVSILAGLVPGGGIAEHELAGKDPGLIEGLDALPGGGSLAALGKAGFFALAKAERKEIFKKIMEILQVAPQKAQQMFEAFELMPDAAKNSWMAQFADMYKPNSGRTALLREHSKVNPDGNVQTAWGHYRDDVKSGGVIGINGGERDDLNNLLHEGGHGFDHQIQALLDPYNRLYGDIGDAGLTEDWFLKLPNAPKNLSDAYLNEPWAYDADAFKQFILNTTPQKYIDAGFTMPTNKTLVQNKMSGDEIKSAVETMNQGLQYKNNHIFTPLEHNDRQARAYAGRVLRDDLHPFDYYFNTKRRDPIGTISTEALAKAMELMPTGFQTHPLGKSLTEVLEDNPVRFYDLDFNPFVGGDLKSLAGTK